MITPLAGALLDAKAGGVLSFMTPAREEALAVLSVAYPEIV